MHTDKHHGNNLIPLSIIIFILFYCYQPLMAEDSQNSRRTLAGLRGFFILVENIQPNIQQYAQKSGLNADQIRQDIEQRFRAAGIRTASGNDWLKMPGRPVLYVNINTHETEKYWYAYDIQLQQRQIVYLEANPNIRTLADTWSINMTGITSSGNLHIIRNDIMVLVEKFIQAYKSVNGGNR
jgi:hypothetical protein